MDKGVYGTYTFHRSTETDVGRVEVIASLFLQC